MNIRGTTIHAALRFRKQMTDLENEALAEFQREMANVRFVIIDEYSMVGCSMMNSIHQRLFQAKNDKGHPFGNVLL